MQNHFNEVAPSIWHYQSHQKGPKTVLSGGIHGNEKAGIHVVNQLVQDIQQGQFLPPGELLLILGNLEAMAANVREVRHNMNRLFGKIGRQVGTEQDRVDLIKKMIAKYMPRPDRHFDLHSTIKPSLPFAVLPQYAAELPEGIEELYALLERLQIGILLYGPGFFGPGGDHTMMDTYLNQVHGAKAMTVEAGSIDDDSGKENLYQGMKGVLMGGKSQGKARVPKIWYGKRPVMKATDQFKFTHPWGNFSPLPEGQPFAQDGGKIWHAGVNEHIVFPNETVAINNRTGVIISPVN